MMVLRIHTRQTLTLSGNLGSPITLMCMFLDVGANVKGLVTNTGKTCKYHKKKNKTKPEATVLISAPPQHRAWITILINIKEWKKHFTKVHLLSYLMRIIKAEIRSTATINLDGKMKNIKLRIGIN